MTPVPTRTPIDLRTVESWYSLRRYYVDEFYARHVKSLPADSKVLDLGGMKRGKKGQFDIDGYPLRVLYANLLTNQSPDVQCDAAFVPFQENCFDTIVCSEMLELVPTPVNVLEEMHRILKPGGEVLLCIPFLYRIQGHPYDYGRYTDSWWHENLKTIGFTDITIEWQGFFASVLMDMMRDMVHHKGGLTSKWSRKMIKSGGKYLLRWGRRKALAWDERVALRQDAFADWYCSYTTGFGIRARKS